MTKIWVEPKAIEQAGKSGIHSTLIAKATAIMDNESQHPQRPPAKGKWLEVVELDEMRLGMSCHREKDRIAVTNIKRLLRK